MLVVGALPVVTRIYPGLPISFPALLGAAIAMGFAWLLAEHATRIRMTLARVALGEFPDMDRGTRVIVENTVLLTAILVGYLGIATITSPIIKPVDAFWLSSLVFWVFALGPLVMIGYHLNPVLDSIADRLADGILRIL